MLFAVIYILSLARQDYVVFPMLSMKGIVHPTTSALLEL